MERNNIFSALGFFFDTNFYLVTNIMKNLNNGLMYFTRHIIRFLITPMRWRDFILPIKKNNNNSTAIFGYKNYISVCLRLDGL